ncbi:hypothetical protein F5148DRAFT_1308820 [Russula earlei]|uniref:Uncharacterized protein n=1 Tax=Russula earlei TaxID=71964 RepID=A0ACC0U6L4_9AGAM|nr:hypothetical protein F5148DRAFT_1308820 [Russula earlei]
MLEDSESNGSGSSSHGEDTNWSGSSSHGEDTNWSGSSSDGDSDWGYDEETKAIIHRNGCKICQDWRKHLIEDGDQSLNNALDAQIAHSMPEIVEAQMAIHVLKCEIKAVESHQILFNMLLNQARRHSITVHSLAIVPIKFTLVPKQMNHTNFTLNSINSNNNDGNLTSNTIEHQRQPMHAMSTLTQNSV